MNFALVLAGLLANNYMCVDATSQSEPQCYIRFDYDFKVVEKLVMLETSYKALKSEMEGLKSVTIRKEGTFVAFSAYLDHTLRNMGNDQIIVFNQIILNEGGGYDQETGVFTCPKSGLYLITFFIGVRGSGDFFATMMINNNSRIDAVAEGGHSTQDLQGGNSILVNLNEDDKLWIKRNGIAGDKLESYPGLRVSTFSGVLLYPQL